MPKSQKSLTISPEQQAETAIATATDIVKSLGWKWAKPGVTLRSQEDYTSAVNALQTIKGLINGAEKQRKELVDPLNGVVKKLNTIFKPTTSSAQQLEVTIKGLLIDYEESQRAKILAEAEKRAKSLEKRSPEMAADVREMALVSPVVPETSGIQYRTRWTFRVTDETQVPREFLIVDERKLQAFATAMKASGVVGGVEFFEERSIAASGK